MILKGKAWKFGDAVSTDAICPGRYYHLRSNLPELARHVLEDVDPEFAVKVTPGDMLVAGENFGLGSSREHAPAIIKQIGISAILARSFARIFFRNAINIGLPVVECQTQGIEAGDQIEVDLLAGRVKNVSRQFSIAATPMPRVMINILRDGGLVAHVQKFGGFILD